MFLIISRVDNWCSDHLISMTIVEKLKMANSTVRCEKVTIEPGDHVDIYAFARSFSSTFSDLYVTVYHCEFVPISSHGHQGQSQPTKNITIRDSDVLVYEQFKFIDDNEDIKDIRIKGNPLARIW